MAEWVSITINLALGLPLAAIIILVARELSRVLIAQALGFRVFEIQWGAGVRRGPRPLGPVDFVWAPLPFAGATVVRSGSPKRHRLARALLPLAPVLLQLSWLIGRLLNGTSPGTAPLFDGIAPLACLDLTNAMLLVVHVTLAIEISPGVRTDTRLLLDALLGHRDSDRAARANYYARLVRHHLERAEVQKARTALDLGRTQFGPVALLVACQSRLDATDLDSVIDQGDCIEDLEQLIEDAEPERTQERAAWTLREHLRQGFFSAVPLTAALLALAFAQTGPMTRSIESGLFRLAENIADAGNGAD